jgi:hypothetical protein
MKKQFNPCTREIFLNRNIVERDRANVYEPAGCESGMSVTHFVKDKPHSPASRLPRPPGTSRSACPAIPQLVAYRDSELSRKHCRSALARDCGGSVDVNVTDLAPSPASRPPRPSGRIKRSNHTAIPLLPKFMSGIRTKPTFAHTPCAARPHTCPCCCRRRTG